MPVNQGGKYRAMVISKVALWVESLKLFNFITCSLYRFFKKKLRKKIRTNKLSISKKRVFWVQKFLWKESKIIFCEPFFIVTSVKVELVSDHWIRCGSFSEKMWTLTVEPDFSGVYSSEQWQEKWVKFHSFQSPGKQQQSQGYLFQSNVICLIWVRKRPKKCWT